MTGEKPRRDSEPEERLMDSRKYVVTSPSAEDEVMAIVSDVKREYGQSNTSFVLTTSYPFDLDTSPELSQRVLEALRERGMRIKRYEY